MTARRGWVVCAHLWALSWAFSGILGPVSGRGIGLVQWLRCSKSRSGLCELSTALPGFGSGPGLQGPPHRVPIEAHVPVPEARRKFFNSQLAGYEEHHAAGVAGRKTKVTARGATFAPEARRIALRPRARGPAPGQGHGRGMAQDAQLALPQPDRQRQYPGPRSLPARFLGLTGA
jgi:hypothetical protein